MDSSAPPHRVSVVIPAYNAEDTLAYAIESALAQSHPPAEVIVVDDGSTDATNCVAARFASVRLIRQARGGPSQARNRGIEEASGEWIAFLDSDDQWHPVKLAHQLDVIERAPNVALVATDWKRWAPDFPPLPPVAPITFLSYRDILVLNRFQTSTVLVRSEILKDCGGFNPELDSAEDWDLWLRCSTATPIAKLDAPYVMYRDVPGGVSKDVWRLYERMLIMLRRERTAARLPARSFDTIVAWHHLRFAVAFLLASDPATAYKVLASLRADGLLSSAPEATVRYLVPFLGGRVARRFRPVRPGGSGRPRGDQAVARP